MAVAPAGCEMQTGSYRDFEDEDPRIRLAAIVRAGQTRDAAAARYLVDRLSDSETDVRLFAIVALRKITGRTFEYRHYEPRRRRAEAVARWRHWLKHRAEAATRPRSTAPIKQS